MNTNRTNSAQQVQRDDRIRRPQRRAYDPTIRESWKNQTGRRSSFSMANRPLSERDLADDNDE